MLAFAANSLLCRMALASTPIDPASFTFVRVLSGAAVLCAIARARAGSAVRVVEGTWLSAAALFAYAAAFSFAYVGLTAATGALLLFGAVQATMLGYGAWTGERLRARQAVGLAASTGGLLALLWPGVSAPPPGAALLMVGAGIAWGIYSLRGRGGGDPIAATAGNFLRATPLAAVLLAAGAWSVQIDLRGALYAVLSGAIASGVGYAVWYTALRDMTATAGALVQLSVPVLAALGAVLMLGEHLTLRLAATSAVILGGVAIAILETPRSR